MARPFLKWAGGKTQLLPVLIDSLPMRPKDGYNYAEAFLGGGALFFELKNRGWIKSATLNDANPELILCYKTIRDSLTDVVKELRTIQDSFPGSLKLQSDFFYEARKEWNAKICASINHYPEKLVARRVALTIFLNKTCYNGLFRVNSKGEFNTPFGKYKNPKICDELNLRNVSESLRDVKLICGDYSDLIRQKTSFDFIYFDPPYRPLTTSSSFTAYNKSGFNDENQKELANFVNSVSKTDTHILLSNSDPKVAEPNDEFFDVLYEGFHIKRILASRMINSKGDGRGKITEILVSNYD
jgi:DNA adenine methylase